MSEAINIRNFLVRVVVVLFDKNIEDYSNNIYMYSEKFSSTQHGCTSL